MANSTTIFRVDCDYSHDELVEQLRRMNYNEVTPRGTEISAKISHFTQMNDKLCYALMTYDEEDGPIEIEGKKQWFPISNQSTIAISENNYLFVFEKKLIADKLSRKIERYLFSDKSRIFNNQFHEDFMRGFVQENSSYAPNIALSGMDTPGRSASLHYGSNVLESEVYKSDLKHRGRHAWALFVVLPERWTIGLSRKGSVVFFSKVSVENQLDFIINRILS